MEWNGDFQLMGNSLRDILNVYIRPNEKYSLLLSDKVTSSWGITFRV